MENAVSSEGYEGKFKEKEKIVVLLESDFLIWWWMLLMWVLN